MLFELCRSRGRDSMNYKLAALETFAIIVCYILVAWPLASATNVNIIFNGQTQATAELSISNLLNKRITHYHDPSDVTWTDVDVEISLSSASEQYTIERIYLYACQDLDPIECARKEPIKYDHYINDALSWKTISKREGTGTYPQVANLLSIIKLVGPNDRVSWVGSWDVVKRTKYDTFNTYSHDISSLDFFAKSADFVVPAKSFIEGYQMLPFNWADKVVLTGSTSRHSLGASDSELMSVPPQFQTAQPQNNQIETINKDFYFVMPDTSSGIGIPVTINLNPSFSCGDNICEIDLGETRETCCFDCGCLANEYCDISDDGEAGSCRNEDTVSIQAQSLAMPTVTDCSIPFESNIKVRVNTPPSSLSDGISAYISLDDTVFTSACAKSAGPEYTCPINLDPEMRCGSGTRQKGPNTVNVTLNYNDGPNVVSNELSTTFPALTITYDCACQEGYYCDAGEARCKSEASVGLQILNATTYLRNFNAAGDNIVVTAKVTNPPTDLTTPGTATYRLGTIYKSNSELVNDTTGNAQCIGSADTNHVYVCTIPVSITNYDNTHAYYIRGNSLTMTATYSNGGTQIVRDLSAPFSDITIPSWYCGDGVQNYEETEENCCLDMGCSGAGQYCDAVRGCQYINNISLSIVSVQPKEAEDCKRTNIINITAKVNSLPYQPEVNYVYYYLNREMQNWGLECSTPNQITGLTTCHLEIPPIDDCELPHYTVGPNSLNMTLTFPDGSGSMVTKALSTPFDDITIEPIWHCGQFECESEYGESGENCCIDCGCGDGEYCDYDPQYNPEGACNAKSDIRLVIFDPSAPVHLDTCEKTHKLTVKARVENQPSGMSLESWYGSINGTGTKMVSCKEMSRYQTSGNSTYECTMYVQSVAECSKGDHYTLENNSLSFFISYTDGMGKRAAQTLTASYPDIELTQSIRSIHDIMQDAISQMQGHLADIWDEMNELLDALETCIKVMIWTAIISVGVSIGVAAFGEKLGGTFPERLTAMSTTTNSAMNTIKNICEMYSEYHQMMIKLSEIEMQMLEMQMCLDLYQHDIDIGNCDGKEINCYQRITSCLKMGEIQQAMGDAQNYLDSSFGHSAEITNSVSNIGEAWEDFGGGNRRVDLAVWYKPGSDTARVPAANEPCNRYSLMTTTTNNMHRDNVEIKITNQYNCYPVIKLNGEYFCAGSDCKKEEYSIDSYTASKTEITLEAYCFEDEADKEKRWGNTGLMKNIPTFTTIFYVYASTGASCGGGGTSPLANGGAIQSIEAAKTKIAQVIEEQFITNTYTSVLSRLNDATNEINDNKKASADSIIDEVIETLTNAKDSLGITDKNSIDAAIASLNTAKKQLDF